MGKKKMIENYQVIQVVGQVEDMYEIIKAKHVQQKKYYTLKKVKIKNDNNNQLYEGFLNQASLLKRFKHPNIAKSIKMMKTATSIYVVYDYCEGQNLLQWMQNGSKKTLSEKQGVLKQLCLVLAELRKNDITHLYLNPQCIYVNQSGDIKVTDFIYGTFMPDTQEEIELNWKVPKTQYTAPEVKKGLASYESDIYSFGKIVQFMEISDSKKGSLTLKEFNTKCDQFKNIIKETTRKKAQQRDTLQQVYRIIFKTKGKIRKMKSMSMSLSKVGGKESMLSRTSRISTATNNERTNDFVQDIIFKILKRRNMARLLIQIFKNIVDVPYINSSDLLILTTLLLKKSTLILNSIGKYMKYAKGIPGMQLQQKERNKLFKSADYFKMQPIIQNQVKMQKKMFQSALQSIYLDNVKLLQNKRFNQQLKKQQLDENYLRQLMRQFIVNSVKQMQIQRQHTNFAKALYLMHLILENAGIQLLFQKKISLFPIQLNEQPLFIKIHKQMKPQQLIEELEKYKM